MKRTLLIVLMLVSLASCSKSDDDSGFEQALLFLNVPEIAAVLAGPSSLSLAVPNDAVNYFSGANLYMGSTPVGQTSTPIEFTISNTHSDNNLILFGVSLDGIAAGDYTIIPPASTNLAPGETTSFSIQFTPSTTGRREATVNVDYNAENGPGTYRIHLTGSPGVDIHMVGSSYSGYGYTGNEALYWKNREITTLPVLDPAKNSYAGTIQISGSDIYIAGGSSDSTDIYQAVYWKNGTLFQLPAIDATQHSSTQDMILSGSDVYIAGYSTNSSGDSIAVYWKNGIRTNLSALNSVATCITISGGDVYVGGFLINGSVWEPVYWKNGTLTALPPMEAGEVSWVSDISVSGSDVYLAGTAYVSGKPETYGIYWENGFLTIARYTSTFYSYASAIQKSGTDLYVLTRSIDIWGTHGTSSLIHNGNSLRLDRAPNRDHYNPRHANANSQAYAMFIHGSDVYSVGSQYRGNLWMNEKLFQISEMSIVDIFVTGP